MRTYVKVYSDELAHHGIKGMKWGVRRWQTKDGGLTPAGRKRYSDAEQNYRDKKAAYKAANKEHRKAFNKASTLTGAYGKNSKELNRKSMEAAKKANKAEAEYKKAKSVYKAEKSARKEARSERKAAIKDTYKKINKEAKISEKLLYNNATRKLAAKYVVDNNMSVSEAKQKANKKAMDNTVKLLAVYGAVTVGTIMYDKTH